ncbi:MAG: S8 family serine peptidase [Nitrospira sp.]|nr:S8 family serine peptidase [Nitrospira sp.]
MSFKTGVSNYGSDGDHSREGEEDLYNLAGLYDLWEKTLGDSRIIIAILDGPCDREHPSLKNANLKQVTLAGEELFFEPASDHGTHIASIIFGQHSGPVKGIAPNCQGVIIPIFKNNSEGSVVPCSQLDLARAIQQAVGMGAHVINISGGQYSATGLAHPALRDAVNECSKQGCLIIAATGNDGCACLHVPGALPSVLAVGAMDLSGNPMEFSNWGSSYQTTGILAPGANILGALPGNRLGTRTGTSYAAPIVSGIAGLLLSLQIRNGQHPMTSYIKKAIIDSALGCDHQQIKDCRRLLAGRLNIHGALRSLINNSRTVIGGSFMSTTSLTPPASPAQPTTAETESLNASTEHQITPAQSLADTSSRNSSSIPLAGEEKGCELENPRDHSMAPPTPFAPLVKASGCACQGQSSSCSCQKSSELVYAIGGLAVDFGTQARLDSFKQAAENFNFRGGKLNVLDNADLLRHLFGWREFPPQEDGKKERKPYFHRSHVYDAKDLTWILTQDESPLYAIQPSGSFSEEGYYELAHFLLEMEGFDDDHEPVPKDASPFNMFYHPSLDSDDAKGKGPNPNRSANEKGRIIPIIEKVAIPGRINGTVRLLNGMEVPVITPNQRGTRSWKLGALLNAYAQQDPKNSSPDAQEKYQQFLKRITQRYMEEARNPGLSGPDRALNFGATHSFKTAVEIRKYLKIDYFPDVDSIEVHPSPTCRKDSECYDVNVAFFDAENLMRAKDVLRYTVDVSDEVPVLLGEPQNYRAR